MHPLYEKASSLTASIIGGEVLTLSGTTHSLISSAG